MLIIGKVLLHTVHQLPYGEFLNEDFNLVVGSFHNIKSKFINIINWDIDLMSSRGG